MIKKIKINNHCTLSRARSRGDRPDPSSSSLCLTCALAAHAPPPPNRGSVQVGLHCFPTHPKQQNTEPRGSRPLPRHRTTPSTHTKITWCPSRWLDTQHRPRTHARVKGRRRARVALHGQRFPKSSAASSQNIAALADVTVLGSHVHKNVRRTAIMMMMIIIIMMTMMNQSQ